HVGGRVIRTTGPHPFYVKDQGWRAAGELQAGDQLRSHDGSWLPVEAVTDSGDAAPVYNLRVADYHTYFVGSRAWAFSAWAHNGGGECAKIMPGAESNPRPPRIGERWKPGAITDPKCQGGGEAVAKQIQKHIGGEIKRIVPKDPVARLGPYRGHIPGERGWAYHEVVVKDGRVYDRFTGHEGLPINDYKALWEYADAINFGF